MRIRKVVGIAFIAAVLVWSQFVFAVGPTYQTGQLTAQNFATTTTATVTGVPANATMIAIANQGVNQSVTFSDSVNGAMTVFFPTAQASGSVFGYYTAAYLYNISSGSHTVTVTLGTSAATTQLLVIVYSGGTLTGTAAVAGTFTPSGANSLNSGTITPSVNGSTIIGVGWSTDLSSTLTVGTSGVTFTSRYNPSGWWLIEDYSQATAGAQAAYFGVSGTATNSVEAFVLALAPSSSCTHNFWASNGSFAIPNGSSGSYWNAGTGTFSTPNCTSGSYWLQSGTTGSN